MKIEIAVAESALRFNRIACRGTPGDMSCQEIHVLLTLNVSYPHRVAAGANCIFSPTVNRALSLLNARTAVKRMSHVRRLFQA